MFDFDFSQCVRECRILNYAKSDSVPIAWSPRPQDNMRHVGWLITLERCTWITCMLSTFRFGWDENGRTWSCRITNFVYNFLKQLLLICNFQRAETILIIESGLLHGITAAVLFLQFINCYPLSAIQSIMQ